MASPRTNWSSNNEFFRSIPVTIIIIAIWVLGFITSILGIPFLIRLFAFFPDEIPNVITGLFTYPLVMGGDIFSLLFTALSMYWFGGSLERSWGIRNYLLFLIGSSFAAAIFWQLGLFLFKGHLWPLAMPWLLISSIIVAWAWLNPEQTILLFFILPVKAKWIGWLTIIVLYIEFPLMTIGPSLFVPILGLFALGGIAFAYAFVWYQRKWAWIPRRRKSSTQPIRHPSSTFWGALTRPYREWQRRRRVAHLQRTIRFDD